MFTGKKTGIVISGADTIEVRFGDEMEFDDLEQEEPRILYENEIYEGDLEFSEELYEDNDEDKTEKRLYKVHNPYSAKDIKYNDVWMYGGMVSDFNGEMVNWNIIPCLNYFLNFGRRFSIINRISDNILSVMKSAGLEVYEDDVQNNGKNIFEILPIVDYNSSLKISN